MVKKFKSDVVDFSQGVLTLGVSGAITGQAAKLSPNTNLGGSINTLAGFAPIAAVGVGGGAALRVVDKLKPMKSKKMKFPKVI